VSSENVYDAVIVGGGVSGVWSGWRLTDSAAGSARLKNVAVFELSDRIGGRLLSISLPGQPGQMCELGGMRYTPAQPLVGWLVETKLGLTPVPFPVYEPENIAFLRGQLLHLGDIRANPAQVPYNLDPSEKASAGNLLGDAILKIAPRTSGLSGEKLRKAVQTATFMGRPIWQQGFWNDIAVLMSGEAFRYAQALGGYDTTQLNWNCADTIVLNSDLGGNVSFCRVKEGYDQVPERLAAMFKTNGGEVHLQQRIVSLTPATLPGGGEGVDLAVEDMTTRRHRTVHARTVVLALPRRSLELLDPSGPIMGDQGFRDLMATVTPIPLFKAFIAYPSPWWTQANVTQGRSVTDLPLRQVYYWYTGKSAEDSLLLATYDDTDDVGFWAGLAVDPQRYGPEPNDPKAEWTAYRAPRAMVHELHRQLLLVHGLSNTTPPPPLPSEAVFQDWGKDPFGGGVNFWNVGVKSWDAGKAMEKPVRLAPVYVVGEAYSDSQGWVEGALRSAENVLTRYFGLPPLNVAA